MGSHSNQFGGNHSNPSSNIYYPFEGTANAAENGLTHAGEICVVADGTITQTRCLINQYLSRGQITMMRSLITLTRR